MSVTASAVTREHPVRAALRAALAEAYGPRLVRAVLYGSRARGDAGPDSDWDVAVFLEPVGDAVEEAYRLADLGTALLDAHDAVVHAMPFARDSYEARTLFMRRVRQEGVPL
ncbi:MAG: nucleotidyltransferase domain-containing protein [Acetobacteraceae bacterium]|nr:nucleotidyltransferase domain-containing protein [Acetobacteraceae bacterium]